MKVEDLIRQKLEADILSPEQFLLKVEHHGHGGGRQKLTIIVDSTGPLTVDHCSEISRALDTFLEESNLIDAAYHLEVSSPGVDVPFTDRRQYLKNAGREVLIWLQDEEQVKGVLQGMSGEEVQIEVTRKEKGKKPWKEVVSIPFSKIIKTKVQLTF
jgi:ribosome maturation factor RimP